MTITRTVFFGIASCLIFGIAAGGYGGWYLGTTYLLNSGIQKQAVDVKRHIEILENLRAGNIAEAIEFLESRLDDDLIILEPTERYHLKEYVSSQVHGALRAAKKYRSEHPRTSKRSTIDDMVRNLLSRDIPDDTN